MDVTPHKKVASSHKRNQLAQATAYESFEITSPHKKGDLLLSVNSLLSCITYLIQTLFGISGGVCLAIIMIRRSDSWITLSEQARDGVIMFGISCCVVAVYTCFLWLVVRLWKKLHESEPK